MDQIGRVIALKDNQAVIELERNSACAKCGVCHMGLSKTMQLEVENSIGADVGKRVLIKMDKGAVLRAGAIVYLLPLLALLLGIGLMYLIDYFYPLSGSPDLWGVGVGFVLFALSFVGIRLGESAWRQNPHYTPTIVRIVEDFEEITDICGHEDNE